MFIIYIVQKLEAMKHICIQGTFRLVLILGLAMMTESCAYSQDDQQLQKAQDAFSEKYPEAKDVEWERDSNGNYEAQFELESTKLRADFDKSGNWIETEQSIEFDDLPKNIQQLVEAKYKKEGIVEIEKVNHHQKGNFYDVEFKAPGKNKDVEISEAGEIIQ